MMKLLILLFAAFAPCCCGLSLAEYLTSGRQGLQGGRPEVILGTHHKTGTVLANKVGTCIKEHAGMTARVMNHIGQGEEVQRSANGEPIIHFLRDPEPWVLSWYMYSKTKSEPWFTNQGSMAHAHGGKNKDAFIQEYISFRGYNITIDPKESIQDFLKRAPEDLGLAVAYRELTRQLEPERPNSLVSFTMQCRSDPMCKEVCLESFGKSRASYDAIWEDIFGFMNINLSNKLQECVKSHYLDSAHTSDHATSGMISEKQHQEYMDMIRQLDKEFGGGRLSQASKDMKCSEATKATKLDQMAMNDDQFTMYKALLAYE